MKSKECLANKILSNAAKDAAEILEHAREVSILILATAPYEVPDAIVERQVPANDSALLGGLRRPEETVRLMLSHIRK